MPTAIILQFVITFGVWIFADRIGLSGVLTMVCYAMTVARTAPERTPARIRIPSYAVWETVVFVMNVLAFVFIGLQLRPILDPLEPALRGRDFVVAPAVLLTVIVVRVRLAHVVQRGHPMARSAVVKPSLSAAARDRVFSASHFHSARR